MWQKICKKNKKPDTIAKEKYDALCKALALQKNDLITALEAVERPYKDSATYIAIQLREKTINFGEAGFRIQTQRIPINWASVREISSTFNLVG